MKVLIYGAGVIGEGKRLNVEMLVLVGLEPYFLVSDPLVPERKTL